MVIQSMLLLLQCLMFNADTHEHIVVIHLAYFFVYTPEGFSLKVGGSSLLSILLTILTLTVAKRNFAPLFKACYQKLLFGYNL